MHKAAAACTFALSALYAIAALAHSWGFFAGWFTGDDQRIIVAACEAVVSVALAWLGTDLIDDRTHWSD